MFRAVRALALGAAVPRDEAARAQFRFGLVGAALGAPRVARPDATLDLACDPRVERGLVVVGAVRLGVHRERPRGVLRGLEEPALAVEQDDHGAHGRGRRAARAEERLRLVQLARLAQHSRERRASELDVRPARDARAVELARPGLGLLEPTLTEEHLAQVARGLEREVVRRAEPLAHRREAPREPAFGYVRLAQDRGRVRVVHFGEEDVLGHNGTRDLRAFKRYSR